MPPKKKATKKRAPLKVFVSYSHRDPTRCVELRDHLAQLEREQVLDVWYDGMIDPKVPWDDDIKKNLRSADIVLCLISARFLNSYYCCKVEMGEAVRRATVKKLPRGQKRATVIPVLLSACDWESCLAGKFNAYPKEPKYINGSRDRRDRGWTQVAKYLRTLAA